MVRKKPLAWISLVVVFAVTALTGCGAASPLAAQVASANPQTVQTAQNAPAASVPSSGSAQTINSSVIAGLESALEQVYTNVSPSVVYIEVRQAATATQGFPFSQSPNGTQQYQYGSGSGFVWDMNGDIVTNNHVVENADQIMVTFSDGTTVPATVVGTNADSDLAVIKVDVSSSLLHPVTMGDSTTVKVGEVAIAIGNPYGLESTMTVGFISGLGRSLPVQSSNSSGPTYSIPDVIQTDAPINPGNSGGVLLNDQGEVVGVTAAIESASGASAGIGFVIPSAIVEKVVPSLISQGSYAVPYLGISGTTLDTQLATAMNLDANQHGVLVADVVAGVPAAQAGLQGSTDTTTIDGQQVQIGGDVIVAINGQTIQTF
jgi:S1-C subfamily serine protease